ASADLDWALRHSLEMKKENELLHDIEHSFNEKLSTTNAKLNEAIRKLKKNEAFFFKDKVKSRYPAIDLSMYDLEEDSASVVGIPRYPIETFHDDKVGLQQDQVVIDGMTTEQNYTRVEVFLGGPTTDVAGTSQKV
ncbi:hypothetical protein PanWU01x14_081740, partial [Parasponia andersonii]